MLHSWYEASNENGRYEIVNNHRTVMYARALGLNTLSDSTASCVTKLACDPGPYTDAVQHANGCYIALCSNIIDDGPTNSSPPWWDDANPTSTSFAGLFVKNVGGWNSTFNRQRFASPLGNAAFGLRKREGRCLTFDGYLVGISQCGIEYGLNYLDALLENLAAKPFTLYSARCLIPAAATTESELAPYLRHIRNVTVTSGPVITESTSTKGTTTVPCGCTECATGAHYARVNFTLCAESSFIYGEPSYELDNVALFDELECDCNVVWNFDPAPKVYGTRTRFYASRPEYGVKLFRDGTVCKVGDWEWSDTQLGGGIGTVVIAGTEERDEDEIVVEDQPEMPAEETNDCGVCQIRLIYDHSTGDKLFQTINWSHDPTEPLPCDCTLEIAEIKIRDPEYPRDDGQDPPVTLPDGPDNSPWIIESPPSGDGCNWIELVFTNPQGGIWQPLGDELHDAWVADGTDPDTFQYNFPPSNATIKPYVGCPDPIDPDFYGFPTEVTVSSDGTLFATFSNVEPDGSTTNAYKGYILPGTESDPGNGVALQPWFVSEIDGQNPGCVKLTNGNVVCSGIAPTALMLRNRWNDPCESIVDRPVKIDTSAMTWIPSAASWTHDRSVKFPNPEANYTVCGMAHPQRTDSTAVEEEYLVSGGDCFDDPILSEDVIFPTFETTCWEQVTLPSATWQSKDVCFCEPLSLQRQCVVYQNPSTVNDYVGGFEVRAGAEDLKNFRVRAWVMAYDDLVSPCTDWDYWADREADFSIEIPHIPSGSRMNVDGETRRITLIFAGGRTESGLRYVTGVGGGPTNFIELGPCEVAYVSIESDCLNTSDTANIDFWFSERSGASGTILPRGSNNAFAGSGGF